MKEHRHENSNDIERTHAARTIEVCFMLGLGGFVLLIGIVAATATMFPLGELMGTLAVAPTLRARSAPLPSAKRLHARH
jgi:hypothetical protein